MSVKFCASLTIRDMRKLRPLLSDSAIGLEPEGGEVADETVIVNTAPATSEPVQPISTPSPQAIDQATQFGEMREAFRQTQGELAETRSAVAGLQSERESLQRQVSELASWRESVQTATREVEAEERRQEEEVTVITPPAPETPKEPEKPPKAKQSGLSRLLFGREEEE